MFSYVLLTNHRASIWIPIQTKLRAISANGPAADRPILTVLIGSLRPPKTDRAPIGADFFGTKNKFAPIESTIRFESLGAGDIRRCFMRVVEGGSPEKEATDGGEIKWRWEDKGCWPSDAQLNIMRGSVEVKQGLETFPSLNSVIKWKLLKTGGKTEEKRQRITDGREQQKSAFAIMEKVAAGLPGAARAEA